MADVLYAFLCLIVDFFAGYLFVTVYVYFLNSYNKMFKQKEKVVLARKKKVTLALLWVGLGLVFRFIL